MGGIYTGIQLVSEEKLVFDFIENLHNSFTQVKCYQAYFSFLMDIFTFNSKDPHTDGFARRSLLILRTFIIDKTIPLAQVKTLLPLIYSKFRTLISLRFNNEHTSILLKNSKEPLWYEVGIKLIEISNYLFESNAKEEKGCIDEELYKLVWEQVLIVLKDVLRVTENDLASVDKTIAEEIFKKCQELDLQLMKFIVNVLLPRSSNTTKEIQIDLIHLIDNGCTSMYSLFALHNRTSGDLLSKFSLHALLSLCNKENITVVSKFSQLTTPVLVKRCKAIFNKYISDEKRSGSVPLPK